MKIIKNEQAFSKKTIKHNLMIIHDHDVMEDNKMVTMETHNPRQLPMEPETRLQNTGKCWRQKKHQTGYSSVVQHFVYHPFGNEPEIIVESKLCLNI